MIRAEAYQQGARYQETEGGRYINTNQSLVLARTHSNTGSKEMVKEKFQADTRENTHRKRGTTT